MSRKAKLLYSPILTYGIVLGLVGAPIGCSGSAKSSDDVELHSTEVITADSAHRDANDEKPSDMRPLDDDTGCRSDELIPPGEDCRNGSCGPIEVDGGWDAWGELLDEVSECKPTVHVGVQEGASVTTPTTVHLSSAVDNECQAPVLGFEWVVQQPVGSTCQFLPSAQAAEPEFQMVLAGTYTFGLLVTPNGAPPVAASEVSVEASPGDAVRIELYWKPTQEGHSDSVPALDIHVAHPDASGLDIDGDGDGEPWFDPQYDCYSGNPSPDWPPVGPDQDPFVGTFAQCRSALADVAIGGVGVYRIGVHYPGTSDSPSVLVFVRIYVYGVPVMEIPGPALCGGDFWEICRVEMPPADVDVVMSDGGGFMIYSNVDM